MPDAEGYLQPGELGLGTYAAYGDDLGEPLRPLAGFGRELPEVEEEFEIDFTFAPTGFATHPNVRFVVPGWSSIG